MTRSGALILGAMLGISVFVTSGCSGTGSTSVGVSYRYGGYYDPYPYWGSTIIVNRPPHHRPPPHRPPSHKPKPKPEHPIARPPHIGRPKPLPARGTRR